MTSPHSGWLGWVLASSTGRKSWCLRFFGFFGVPCALMTSGLGKAFLLERLMVLVRGCGLPLDNESLDWRALVLLFRVPWTRILRSLLLTSLLVLRLGFTRGLPTLTPWLEPWLAQLGWFLRVWDLLPGGPLRPYVLLNGTIWTSL